MRILLCLLCLLPLAAVAATDAGDDARLKSAAAPCPKLAITPAEAAKPPSVHPLTEEPGARQEIAVQHTDANGCVQPIVVRENVGGKSK